MEWALILVLIQEATTKGNGKMTYNMAKVVNSGKMVQIMKVNLRKEKKVVMDCKNGLMDHYILESGSIT